MTHHSLLNDTLRFLQESFSPKTTWAVSPTLFHALQKKETLAPLLPKAPPAKQINIKESPPLSIPKETPLEVRSLTNNVQKLFPTFSIKTASPSDQGALFLQEALQSEVLILSFRESGESDRFLQNIQLAISSHFTKAALIDAKQQHFVSSLDLLFHQSGIKLTLASHSVFAQPSLLPLLKELPSSQERFLGKSKLFLLSPFELYLKTTIHKQSLWNTLCTLLANPNTPASS